MRCRTRVLSVVQSRRFCFASHPSGTSKHRKRVFIHSADFRDFSQLPNVDIGTLLEFDIDDTDPKGPRGRNVEVLSEDGGILE
jgi:hypothetical protein